MKRVLSIAFLACLVAACGGAVMVSDPPAGRVARLDRGLSTPRALQSEPGTYPDEERGLNDAHYIVPGAGGMGELPTNSWV